MNTDDIINRTRLMENEIKVRILNRAHPHHCNTFFDFQIMKSESSRLSHEQQAMKDKIKVGILCMRSGLLVFFFSCYLASNMSCRYFNVGSILGKC